MPCQLPFDCLGGIFEYLEKDKVTLYSCLLVNRLWCEASVRILWRNIRYYNYAHPQIFSNLIACLPNESKDLLKGIFIIAPTSKPPLFNYASFFKVLSIKQLGMILEKNIKSIVSSNNRHLVEQEILKMFMKQISSLKKMTYDSNIIITSFPGAKDCLTDLSKLRCKSDVPSEFLYQLSQICHNIQSLNIMFNETNSNGLTDLITSQNNLKYLSLTQNSYNANIVEVVPSLMKHSNTLIKLKIRWVITTLSFITKFTNLQKLVFSYDIETVSDFPFNELQYSTFPQLQILKFSYCCPEFEMLIKFLEVNGKNLKELHTCESDNSLNLAIAKFCPKIKFLYTLFKKNEMETLKIIFNGCQQLESIESWYGCDIYLDEKVTLEIVANHSPKNFHELRLCYIGKSKLLSRDLESFFISWKNRMSQNPLSIIINDFRNYSLEKMEKNMEIIEKYKKLGIIKKFELQD